MARNFKNVLGEDGQLCWFCNKSTNSGCSWSKELKPIKNWNADEDAVPMYQGNKEPTYKIYGCPEFERG
jgi:hypothetical protein